MVEIPQWIVNLGGLVLTGICGWFLRVLWEAQKKMAEDLKAVEINLARNYVPSVVFENKIDRLFAKLDRIEDKLDGKVDKDYT